jgi:hypothetical protein
MLPSSWNWYQCLEFYILVFLIPGSIGFMIREVQFWIERYLPGIYFRPGVFFTQYDLDRMRQSEARDRKRWEHEPKIIINQLLKGKISYLGVMLFYAKSLVKERKRWGPGGRRTAWFMERLLLTDPRLKKYRRKHERVKKKAIAMVAEWYDKRIITYDSQHVTAVYWRSWVYSGFLGFLMRYVYYTFFLCYWGLCIDLPPGWFMPLTW